MGRDSELIRLEEYVERLLDGFTSLRAEKQRLERELQEQQTENSRLNEDLNSVDTGLRAEKQRLEKELQEQQAETSRLNEALNSFDTERTDVCDRVNSLIERLESWEAELEDDTSRDDIGVQEGADVEPPAQELGEEDGVSEEDGGGGIQGSLFSA